MSLIGGVAPFERIYLYIDMLLCFFVNIDFNIYIYIFNVSWSLFGQPSRAMLIISPCTTGRCIAVCPLKEVPIEREKDRYISYICIYRYIYFSLAAMSDQRRKFYRLKRLA
jgi:hypothetical protein